MTLLNSQLELIEAIFVEHYPVELFSPIQHLRIYQHNIEANIINLLRDIYPLTVKLIGDDFFRQTAKEYMINYPSRSGNLHDYGEYFGLFLMGYQPLKDYPYISEVAQFEWNCHSIFFAADRPAANLQLLADIPSNQYHQLQFMLHPASCLMQYRYPLLSIIDLCKGEFDGTIDISAGGGNLLIFRKDFDMRLIALENDEYIFLSTLSETQSIETALERALHNNPHFELSKKLPIWISEKIIVDCF